MKTPLFFILLMCFCVSAGFSVPAIAQKPLDELIIYEVPVTELVGNTTILFPSTISGIFPSRAAMTPQPNADFLIDYQSGSYYFTIRALKDGVEDYINVIFNKKAYVFHVFPSKKPYRTLTLFYPSRDSKGSKAISPEKLLSLLDKVKSYSLLAAQHPEAVEGVMHTSPNKVMNYNSCNLIINDVYRFEEEDTLIFSTTLENKTDHIITYDPQNVTIGLKENLYSTSIVDAAGDIPPSSKVTAYFGITGTATGGRNNLSPVNDWNIILLTQKNTSLNPHNDKNPIKSK